MADRIDNLPSSTDGLSSVDKNALQDLFRVAKTENDKVNLTKLIIPACAFIILSLPIVDRMLKSTISDSETVVLFAKVVAFTVVLLVIQLV
jgi:hypothetical protein